MKLSRNTKLVAVALAVVAIAVVLFTSLAQGSGGSALDAGLKQTAERLQKDLAQPDKTYASLSFLNAFNLYQATERAGLRSHTRDVRPGQFAQLVVWESQTMPPVWQNITQPGKPQMAIDGSLINQVDGGKSVSTTVHQGNLEFRGYLTPLPLPQSLRINGAHAVLEVFQASQS